MEPSKLNLDVLLQIAALAEKTTQSHIMKTCRILNKEGARELLKEQVWLNSERQLVSFVLFMLADKRIRFAALREFYLELDEDISQNSGEMLSDLFIELSTAANTRLQKLRLSWETEDILLAHPRLSEGIAHLTTLKAIKISCVGSQGSRLLTNLRSSLTYAAVDFDRDALGRKTSLSDGFDPLPLLQTSRNTLESLQLSHAWYMLTSNIVAYPRLTTLTVASRWVPYVPILHRAFPNLTEITSYFGIACTPLEIPSISIVAEYRAANRTYQLNHGSWAEFDSFHGPSRDLYILGLLCRIQYIDLCHYLGDSIDVGGLQTILSDTRPTHLLLSARLQPDDTFLSEQWMVALFQTRTPPLRALEVTMEVSQLNCNHEDMLYDALVSDGAFACRTYSMTRAYRVRRINFATRWEPRRFGLYASHSKAGSAPKSFKTSTWKNSPIVSMTRLTR